MRLLGAALIVAGCGGLGFGAAGQLLSRVAFLRQYLDFLVLLEYELQAGHACLADAFASLAKKLPGDGAEWRRLLGDTACALRQSAGSLQEIWLTQCQKAFASRPIPEVLQVQQLGSRLGLSSMAAQLQMLELEQTAVKRYAQQLEQTVAARCRIYRSLGVLGGGLLAIVFL